MKALGEANCFGSTSLRKTISSTFLMSGSVNNGNCGFPKCWDMKNNMFKDNSIFSCIRWSISVINKGCKGPDLVIVFEVPEMVQKVLEYVWEPELAILE